MAEISASNEYARAVNNLLVQEYARYLGGYPEEEEVLQMKLTDTQKFDLLTDSFRTILNMVKQKNPKFFDDPFRRVLAVHSPPHPKIEPIWTLAIFQAEHGKKTSSEEFVAHGKVAQKQPDKKKWQFWK